jgi:hypothetical protein
MPIAITSLLFVFWVVMAYRQFQRGDLLLAGLFLVIGVVLSAYRVTAAKRLAKSKAQSDG